jgi:glycosyltransferase involved in cell wall biosynthesis
VLSYLGIPSADWLRERRRGSVLGAAVRGCDAVTALSGYAADAFRRNLGYEAPVIPPGVDLAAFRPGERAEVPTIVCSAAADEPRKNMALVVEAFALVRAARPDAELVLSRPRDPLGARRAGVPDEAPGVTWADLDQRPALARAYARAWTSVLAAPDEAFGLVLVEALACGTPVVGYDDGGIPEIIDRPGVGRKFARLRARELADALLEGLELAGDPGTSRRCRARAGDYSSERFTQRYLELYRSIGATPGAS